MKKLITVYVSIGKSKQVITYTFKTDDFIRIEEDRLFLKTEERVLKLSEEQIKNLIFQFNFL